MKCSAKEAPGRGLFFPDWANKAASVVEVLRVWVTGSRLIYAGGGVGGAGGAPG